MTSHTVPELIGHLADLAKRQDSRIRTLAARMADMERIMAPALQAVTTRVPSPAQADYLAETAALHCMGDTYILDELDFRPPVYLYDAALSTSRIDAYSYISSGAYVSSADIGSYCSIGEQTTISVLRPLHNAEQLSCSALLSQGLFFSDSGLCCAGQESPPPSRPAPDRTCISATMSALADPVTSPPDVT